MIDDAEDVVMPMYDLLEYSQNYCVTPGSSWNYYKDNQKNQNHFDKNASDSKSFKYKTIIGKTEARPARPPQPDFDLPLINGEIEVDFKWSRNCVLIEEDDDIM